MIRIVGLSGSLRRGSYNTALLRAAARLMPADAELIVRTVAGIPLYDGDLEAANGIPPVVAELKDLIAGADGLILATPEYNHGIPGVFKNAVDWLSRPAVDARRVFGAKPVSLVGASPGGFGTIQAQAAWLPTLRTLGTRPWFGGRLYVASADDVFDAQGDIGDARTREQLQAFLAGFVAFVG
jgi:NAD(P)H-dependent FMN reductase